MTSRASTSFFPPHPLAAAASASAAASETAPVYVIDPELAARQLEYEQLATQFIDGDATYGNECTTEGDDVLFRDHNNDPTNNTLNMERIIAKGFKSRREVKAYFKNLGSNDIRAEVAGIWLQDSFHARPIEYPANKKELASLFAFRSVWLFYLFNTVAILQIIGPLVEKPWCGRHNVATNLLFEDRKPTRLLFSFVDVLAVIVYSFDAYLLMSINFAHYKQHWYKKGWTNVRMVALVLLIADLIDFYSSIGKDNSPRLIRCLYPIFFISRRRNLRLMVQGIGRSIYYTRHIVFFLFCVLVLWGFMGFFLFQHVPENLNRWNTPWNAIFTCLHGFTSRPINLTFVNALFDHSQASMLFFVTLSIVADLLCINFIIANGTREYKLFCVKVLNQRLSYRHIALNTIFDAYAVPIASITNAASNKATSATPSCKVGSSRSEDRAQSLDPRVEVVRKEDWVSFVCNMPQSDFKNEEVRRVLAADARIIFDIEERGMSGGIFVGRVAFFRMCALVSAEVSFTSDNNKQRSDLDIVRDSLDISGEVRGVADSNKIGDRERQTSLTQSEETNEVRPSVELRRTNNNNKNNNNNNNNHNHKHSVSNYSNNSLLSGGGAGSGGIGGDDHVNSSKSNSLTDQLLGGAIFAADDNNNSISNDISRTSSTIRQLRQTSITVEPKDKTEYGTNTHYIEDTYKRVRGRWGNTTADATKSIITYCRLFFMMELIFRKNLFIRLRISDLIGVLVHILLVVYLSVLTKEGSIAVFNLGWWFQAYFWIVAVAELVGFGRRGARNQSAEFTSVMVLNIITFILMFLVQPNISESPALMIYVILHGLRLTKLLFFVNDYSLFRNLFPLLGRCLFLYFAVVYFFAAWAQVFFCSKFDDANISSRDADDDSDAWLKFSNILNFDSMPLCLFTMFEMSILGNWSIVMDALVRSGTGPSTNIFLFFYTYRLVMTLAIIPVLLAFIMQAFLSSSSSTSKSQKVQYSNSSNTNNNTSNSSSGGGVDDESPKDAYRDTINPIANSNEISENRTKRDGPLGLMRMEVNPSMHNRGSIRFDLNNKSSAVTLWANNGLSNPGGNSHASAPKNSQDADYIQYLENKLAESNAKIAVLERKM